MVTTCSQNLAIVVQILDGQYNLKICIFIEKSCHYLIVERLRLRLIVGPQRSGSAFHIDPNATHAWNAPIRGRKRWIFYPPGVPPPGVLPSSNGDDVIMPVSVGEWYLSFWDEHVKNRNNKDKSKRPIECTVEPGSILFVPHGWVSHEMYL